MFEANAEDELWQNQKEWNLKSWNFYENCGVHILILEDGTDIHMLVERRYPLTTRTLERMLSLMLIVESASDVVYESGWNDRGENKELASPKQMTLALAIPEQMTTVGLDLSKLAILLNRLRKIHSNGLTKMLIDNVVNAAQVTTAIADIPVSAAETIVTTTPTITAESTKTNVEVTQASKRKGVMIQEPEETTPTKTASSQQSQVQDKGKGKAKLIEEPMKLKKKDQILFDKEANVDANYELAERLQTEEQEQLKNTKKAKLFMKFIEKRRKFFAAKRTTEKRNKPPTKVQQRSIMSTYLKNMDGWKPRALKNKSFAKIKELFDKSMKRINNFIDFRTELVEVSTKKDEGETAQESISKRA
nr:hypothetical protein [Tanacetum cinerariifolium]